MEGRMEGKRKAIDRELKRIGECEVPKLRG